MYSYIVVVCHKIMRFICCPHGTPGIVDSYTEKANQVEMLDGLIPSGWLIADCSELSTMLKLNHGIYYA